MRFVSPDSLVDHFSSRSNSVQGNENFLSWLDQLDYHIDVVEDIFVDIFQLFPPQNLPKHPLFILRAFVKNSIEIHVQIVYDRHPL